MLSVLFNPNGRIGPRTFWRGIVLLLGAMIIINILSAYAGPVGQMLGLLTLAAPYCYLCVYGKRLHDSGKSAWFFLLFFIGYFILEGVFQTVLMPFLSPAASVLQDDMTLLMEQGQWMEALAYAPEIAKASLMTALVSLILANIVLGFLAARLKSDPGPNEYGPPEGAAVSDPF
ncbi:MAG: DUF805 domain-containing protein [Pseudomonadota bacterium]